MNRFIFPSPFRALMRIQNDRVFPSPLLSSSFPHHLPFLFSLSERNSGAYFTTSSGGRQDEVDGAAVSSFLSTDKDSPSSPSSFISTPSSSISPSPQRIKEDVNSILIQLERCAAHGDATMATLQYHSLRSHRAATQEVRIVRRLIVLFRAIDAKIGPMTMMVTSCYVCYTLYEIYQWGVMRYSVLLVRQCTITCAINKTVLHVHDEQHTFME